RGAVMHLHTVPDSSNQVAGLGIIVQTADPIPDPPPRVDILEVTVSDFQKTGIVFSGCDCAADGGPTGSVRESTVESDPSALVARNGIQVSFGAGGVVLEDNRVNGMRFTGNPALGLGSAVILASSRADQVRRNVISDSNFGISNIGDIFCAPRADENLANQIQCNQIRDNEFSGNTQFAIFTRSYFPPSQSDADATNNYWGSPTGPTIASNPGGTGDPLDDRVAYTPFYIAPPPCTRLSVVAISFTTAAGLAILSALLAGSALLLLRRR